MQADASRVPMKVTEEHQVCDDICEQIMGLLAQGLTAVEIARVINLSPHWVRTRIRKHQGIAKKVAIPQRTHSCDYRCTQILKLRASGMTYVEMSKKIGLTKQRIGQIVIGHNHAIKKAGGRSGISYCVTCRRKVGSTMPDTTLLPKDEACGWCCRRWDGDVRNVTPALLEVARMIGTQNPREAMQRLHAQRAQDSHKVAKVRERSFGPALAADFEEREERDES